MHHVLFLLYSCVHITPPECSVSVSKEKGVILHSHQIQSQGCAAIVRWRESRVIKVNGNFCVMLNLSFAVSNWCQIIEEHD